METWTFIQNLTLRQIINWVLDLNIFVLITALFGIFVVIAFLWMAFLASVDKIGTSKKAPNG